jgi:hypothetical protein
MRGTGKHPKQQLVAYCQNPDFQTLYVFTIDIGGWEEPDLLVLGDESNSDDDDDDDIFNEDMLLG